MSESIQITMYCQECGGAILDCKCKGKPVFLCGTCQQPYHLCKCEFNEIARRCNFCMQFKAYEPHAATGIWVCPDCLNNKGVQYQLKQIATAHAAAEPGAGQGEEEEKI
jgi:hypothetical protein